MRYRVLFVVLLALTICCSSSYASVTINGKALDQIDDIIEFTTGSHVDEKFSLLKFMKDKGGAFSYYPVYGKADGSSITLTQGGVHNSESVAHQAGKTNTGVYPVVGRQKTSDGKLVVLFPAAQTDNKLFINSIKITGNNKNYSLTDEGCWYKTIEEKANLYVNDSASGILPNGNDGNEIFAVSYFIANGGKRPGFKQSYDSYVALVDPEGQSWKLHRIGTMNGTFPSIRVTAGDFDNDGKAQELAVIRDGSDMNYYMQVFRVDSGLNLNEIYHASIGKRNDDGDNIDGCDITAGDFNGDGKNEIAVIYANKINYDGYPSITIFSWDGSSFTQKTDNNEDNGVRVGSTYWTRSSYVPHFGIIAEAGDINDDGSDELVFLTASYGSSEGNIVVSVWETDNNLQPKRKFYRKTSQKIAGYGGVAGTNMAECSYLPRSLSLALVPTGEKLSSGGSIRKIFISRTQGDDSVKSSSDYRTGDQTFYCTPQFNGTNLTGISDITLFNQGGAGRAMTLAAGDFYGETLELGEPEHIIIQGHKNYAINLKVPPYHVDYIQAPWMTAKPANPFNFSYLGRNVQFMRTQEDSDETLVTSRTQNAIEGGVNLSYNVNMNVKIPALIEGSIKGGFDLGASAGLTRVKEVSDKQIYKSSLSDKLKTTTADALMYTTADYHIWRYPVLQQGNANFAGNFTENALLDEDNAELSGQYFITYTLCDEASEHYCDSNSSAQYDDYNPIYEEGNLFSYPNSVSFGMNNAQKELSSPKYFDLTTETAQTLSFTNAGSSSEKVTTSWKAAVTGDIHADVNVGVPIKFANIGGGWSAKLYGKYSHEAANGVTSTKTWSSTEKVDISANTDKLLYTISEAQYTTGSQVFINEAGVLTTPFSVNFGANAWLWNRNSKEGSQSPYVISSDPALVMPGRYVQEKDKSEAGVMNNVWKFSKNEAAATRIRGMKIYDNVTKQYVSGVLEKGWSYTISVPVYNASFVDVPGDGVVIEYGYQNEDGSGKTQIGRQTIPLKGWSNTQDTDKGGSNKGTLIFDWTPDITEGDYDFYVILDPDNLISEIHESWTHDTRDGNNNGYYPFSVIKTPDVNTSAFVSDVTSGDFTLRFWDVNNPEVKGMTAQELREYVLAQDNVIEAKGQITYTGTQVLTNVEVLTLCKSFSDGVSNVVSLRRIPAIRPGKVREFYFTISPEKLSDSKFSVEFSSSNGKFTVNGGGDSNGNNNDNDNDDSPNLESSSGGCNMGFAYGLIILSAGLIMSFRRSK